MLLLGRRVTLTFHHMLFSFVSWLFLESWSVRNECGRELSFINLGFSRMPPKPTEQVGWCPTLAPCTHRTNPVPSYCECCPLMELLSPPVFAFIQVMAVLSQQSCAYSLLNCRLLLMMQRKGRGSSGCKLWSRR